jgi:broad specificity phosphatase PhoE
MPMNTVLLLRHGQSEQHVRDITGGWSDVPLTEVGRRQAHLTAARVQSLVGDRPVRLFTSDLIRAAETARIIGGALSIPSIPHPGLRELNNGRAAGLTRAQAEAIALPLTEPAVDWVPYPEAESWRQMERRVFECLEEIAEQCADSSEPVILVTHGNSGVAVLAWWLRLCEPCRRTISFELDACSVTELQQNEFGERMIVRLNDTAHLSV